MVRLVRACGSKPKSSTVSNLEIVGQARKSLWIETLDTPLMAVVIALVRLVRACGSKLFLQTNLQRYAVGQARKSLWIETSE